MEKGSQISFENYHQNEIKFNGIAGNIIALVLMILFGVLFGFIFYQIWGTFGINISFDGFQFSIYIIYYFVLYFLVLSLMFFAFLLSNELLIGLYWSKYTEVKIKVLFKQSFFRFCYCKEPIMIKKYVTGYIIPAIIFGIIPIILGMIYGKLFIMIFGIMFISNNGTEPIMLMYLLRKINKTHFIKNMDSAIGIILFSPK